MSCSMCQNIEFVKRRDGLEAARLFSKQAVIQYKKAVLVIRGRVSRKAMISAYLCAKRYK